MNKIQEEMKCGICGSDRIVTDWNVGFDIDPSGEENQHIDNCIDCKAWRFNIDRIDYEEENTWKEVKQYGHWIK